MLTVVTKFNIEYMVSEANAGDHKNTEHKINGHSSTPDPDALIRLQSPKIATCRLT